jgi:hypothetical protein
MRSFSLTRASLALVVISFVSVSFCFGQVPTPAQTPLSTQLKDLSVFQAAPGVLRIRNNGSECHIAVIAWVLTGTVERLRIRAHSEVTIPAGIQGLYIVEEPCQ